MTLAVLTLLMTLVASPASADAPQRWVVEIEQEGINPCTEEPIVLKTEVLFSVKVNLRPHPFKTNTTLSFLASSPLHSARMQVFGYDAESCQTARRRNENATPQNSCKAASSSS